MQLNVIKESIRKLNHFLELENRKKSLENRFFGVRWQKREEKELDYSNLVQIFNNFDFNYRNK
jgi:hypothetical protein